MSSVRTALYGNADAFIISALPHYPHSPHFPHQPHPTASNKKRTRRMNVVPSGDINK